MIVSTLFLEERPRRLSACRFKSSPKGDLHLQCGLCALEWPKRFAEIPPETLRLVNVSHVGLCATKGVCLSYLFIAEDFLFVSDTVALTRRGKSCIYACVGRRVASRRLEQIAQNCSRSLSPRTIH